MQLLIGVLVFIGLGILILALVGGSQSVRMGERLQAVQQESRVLVRGTSLHSELSKSFFDRLGRPLVLAVRDRIVGMAPSRLWETTRARLDQAGNPSHLTVPTFITLKFVALFGGAGLALMLLILSHAQLGNRLLLAACLVAVGLLGPDYMLQGQVRARQARIKKTLPDVIDLLVVSAESGTGLDGALQVVIKRKHGPLPDEFNRLLSETRLGKSRQEAWHDMSERVGLTDLSMLVAALRQAEQLGVSIANTLRTQADAIRTRRSMQIRQLAATLSVKMLFPLIFCILPALFIVVLGPGLMSLTTGFASLGW